MVSILFKTVVTIKTMKATESKEMMLNFGGYQSWIIMTDNAVKQKILSEFESMKLIEQDAHRFYCDAAEDTIVTDRSMRNHLQQIAEDENHHTELVDRLINIIQNCL